MRKFIYVFLICIFSVNIYADYESPMTKYKDNYFIAGNEDVKFQVSAKYNIFYPFDSGIYFGYTQKSWWKIYDSSSPFYETNYMPEAFIQFESGRNMFGDAVIPGIDYIKVSPIFHKSNGQDEADNRSLNLYYGEIQVSAGDIVNIGASGKVFGYYNKAKENYDINKYNKNYEANIFIKLKSKNVQYLDKEELNIRFAGNPAGNGWYEVEFKVRILTTYVQPKLFFQFRNGYDEFLINYNEKHKSFRAGLVF